MGRWGVIPTQVHILERSLWWWYRKWIGEKNGMTSTGKVGTLKVIRVINDEDLSQNDHNENGKEAYGMKYIWDI